MAEPSWRLPKVERQLRGEPVPVGEMTVQPVARLEYDWGGKGGDAGSGGSGGRLRLRPDKIIVQREGQHEQQIVIGDIESAAYRAMLVAAVGVMAASIAFSIVMALRTMGRKENISDGLS